jgi:hypothetical protein
MFGFLKSGARKIVPQKRYEVTLVTQDNQHRPLGKFSNSESVEHLLDTYLSTANNNKMIVKNLDTGEETMMDWRHSIQKKLDEVI